MTVAPVEIVPLAGIDARYEPVDWPFAREHESGIAALWAEATAAKPQLFNGTVLMQHRWTLRDGIYETGYAPVDYASFTGWTRLGKPGSPRRNGFAMAALQAADGPFILGVMGAHNYNSGKIYFAGGTPDMGDVTADGRVDLHTSMLRELMEETGLRENEFDVASDWTLVVDEHRAAFLKGTRLVYPADEARRIILSRLATETDGELSDVAIVRGPSDIDESRMPAFAAAYMRSVFAGG